MFADGMVIHRDLKLDNLALNAQVTHNPCLFPRTVQISLLVRHPMAIYTAPSTDRLIPTFHSIFFLIPTAFSPHYSRYFLGNPYIIDRDG